MFIYFIGKLIVKKFKINYYLFISLFLLFYIIYGILVFGGDFWQIEYVYSKNIEFLKWLQSEQRDWYFSITSTVGVIYFASLTFNEQKKYLQSHDK